MPDPRPGILGLDQPPDQPAPRLRSCAGGYEPDPDWLSRHEGFVRRAREGNAELFLIGDSLTDLWQTACPDHYRLCFAPWRTVNFAISGDRTEHVLWRLDHGEMDGLEPRVIMLLIGTNNLPSVQGVYSAQQPPQVASGVREILARMRRRWPHARILLPSIPPREDRLAALPPAIPEDLNPKVIALNAMIAALADGHKLKYVDMFDTFLDARGRLLDGVMPDKLHPAEKGYRLWARAVLPLLRGWLDEKP